MTASQIDTNCRTPFFSIPIQRYEEVAEFAYDLRHPNREFLSRRSPPLIERNPVAFWKGVSLALALVLIAVLSQSSLIR